MLLRHPAHPGRGVRLAYSQNVHPAASVAELHANLRAITVPLRERLDARGDFGVGLYLAAPVAEELEARPAALAELRALLAEHALDPFTYNAFPYAGFGAAGLKAAVFDPPWSARERVDYTARVARLACALARSPGASREREPRADGHLSISTHTGAHSSRVDAAVAAAIPRGFAQALVELGRLERESGRRVVLALEPEPRANVNDLAALAAWRGAALPTLGPELAARHLGACIDACHAAVEFEEPERALSDALRGGAPLGKLQYTSALALREPARHPAGREQLFALDEPRYLHQVTARGAHGLARAGDLGEARAAFERGEPAWCDAQEWRCHFHVPTDLDSGGADGLRTTRAHAESLLAAAVGAPERWGTAELHLEIETYTWSILPRAARGDGELVDGLEREYRHVLGCLGRLGWTA